MPRVGAHINTEELTEVLSQYSHIHQVNKTQTLQIGNARAPKKILFTDNGKFLLKRRQKGKDDLYHIAFAHSIQLFLQENGFPVPPLYKTKNDNTVVQFEGYIYELFGFIEGSRFASQTQQAVDAGRKLARFHTLLNNLPHEWHPLRGTFHDSSAVRRHLKIICSDYSNIPEHEQMRETANELMKRYNMASTSVNELGFDSWPEQVIHCDWHPGNMLFKEDTVVAVLDFDCVRIAPPVTDLANGVLQFSIIAGCANPVDWPDEMDINTAIHFISGYISHSSIEKDMLKALPELMTETMIAEAVLPIATTGYFGKLPGAEFLDMILRKCKWIDTNQNVIRSAVLNEHSNNGNSS